MGLPRYTDEEIKKIDEEIREEIEADKADFKPRGGQSLRMQSSGVVIEDFSLILKN